MKRTIRNITVIMILLLLTAGSITAQIEMLHYTWTPPIDGALVKYYEVEQSTGDDIWSPIDTTTVPECDVEAPIGWSTIRVRGVSEYDVAGPWSEASRPYMNVGEAPGFCTNIDYGSK